MFKLEATGRTDVLCCFTLTRKAFSCFGIKLSCQGSRHESAARSVMGGRGLYASGCEMCFFYICVPDTRQVKFHFIIIRYSALKGAEIAQSI